SVISLVSDVFVSTSRGRTFEYAGTIRTSSKVSASSRMRAPEADPFSLSGVEAVVSFFSICKVMEFGLFGDVALQCAVRQAVKRPPERHGAVGVKWLIILSLRQTHPTSRNC